MTQTDLAAVAARQQLGRMLTSFPDEVARAWRLAEEQAAAMAAFAVPAERTS